MFSKSDHIKILISFILIYLPKKKALTLKVPPVQFFHQTPSYPHMHLKWMLTPFSINSFSLSKTKKNIKYMKHRINSEPRKMSCYSALSIEKYSCVSYSNRRMPSCKVQETIPSVTGSRGRDCFSAACRQGMCSNLLSWHSWIPLFPGLDPPHQTKHFVSHTLWAGTFIWQSGEFSLFRWVASLHLSQACYHVSKIISICFWTD